MRFFGVLPIKAKKWFLIIFRLITTILLQNPTIKFQIAEKKLENRNLITTIRYTPTPICIVVGQAKI